LKEQAHIVSTNLRKSTRRAFKRVVGWVLPFVSLPQRIEGGARWYAANDWVGDAIYDGTFERPQRRFVERYLQPGMVMLDIGAHHGLYSMIAAGRVGPMGKVISFEPSPRERERLQRHRAANRFDQITIESVALGAAPGKAVLYAQRRRGSGFNSLRPAAALRSGTIEIEVDVETLDDYLRRAQIHQVDLVKLDVEGGELDALKGATHLLSSENRPLLLAEVEDERTEPWGYKAVEIVRLLEAEGYVWLSTRANGWLSPFDTDRTSFDDNLVAVPGERMDTLAHLFGPNP
jgi:FkbM family methyltransferase